MSKCNDCIYYGNCLRKVQALTGLSPFRENDCDLFADKALYLKTPCKKGTVLYRITYPYRSEPKVTEFVVVGFATMGKKHQEVYVQVRVNGVQGVNVMRFRNFTTDRAEAERQLQEVLNGKSH